MAVDPNRTLFGIAEGIRNDRVMQETGATWERLVVSWSAAQPNGAGDLSRLGQVLPVAVIEAQVDRGVRIAGLVQFTPRWAQANPPAGRALTTQKPRAALRRSAELLRTLHVRARPGLRRSDRRVDHLERARVQTRRARRRRARTRGSAPTSSTRSCSRSAIARSRPPTLTRWCPSPARRTGPTSTRSATSIYERILAILERDSAARANGFYHDAVALNLYRTPDDIYRVHRCSRRSRRSTASTSPCGSPRPTPCRPTIASSPAAMRTIRSRRRWISRLPSRSRPLRWPRPSAIAASASTRWSTATRAASPACGASPATTAADARWPTRCGRLDPASAACVRRASFPWIG